MRPNEPPRVAFSTSSEQTICLGTVFLIEATAVDAEDQPRGLPLHAQLSSSIDGLLFEGLLANNGEFALGTLLSAGVHDIGLRVTDSSGATSEAHVTTIVDGQDENGNVVPDCQDLDQDGFVDGDDCGDQDPQINPSSEELCNAVDDNCDGQIDELFDMDADSITACGGDCDDFNPLARPGQDELLNGFDDDCDGTVDEGAAIPVVLWEVPLVVPPNVEQTFHAHLSDDHPLQEIGVEFSLDGGPAMGVAVSEEGWVELSLALSCGSHLLRLVAIDPFGGEGLAQTTVESDANPAAEVESLPNSEWEQGRRLVLSGTVGDECDGAEGLLVQWESSLDGVLATMTADSAGTAVLSTTDLSPGTHELLLVATDAAGRVGRSSQALTVVPYQCDDIRVVAHYGFEMSAADLSGHGNNLTLEGGTWVEGAPPNGTALYLDGMDDNVSAPDNASLDLDTSVSVEAWIYLDRLPPGSPQWWNIVSKGNANFTSAGGANRNYSLYVRNDGRVHWSLILPGSASQGDCRNSEGAIVAGQWVHIVVTADPAEGGTKAFYINGELDSQWTNCGNTELVPNDDPLFIGRTMEWNNRLPGNIDNVRILPCELTEGQVKELFEVAMNGP